MPQLKRNFVRTATSFLIFGALILGACDIDAPPATGDCGANALQPLIGHDAIEVVKFIETQPKSVQDNAYYFGEDETVGSEIPKNALIVVLDVDHVDEPHDLLGAKITDLHCNI